MALILGSSRGAANDFVFRSTCGKRVTASEDGTLRSAPMWPLTLPINSQTARLSPKPRRSPAGVLSHQFFGINHACQCENLPNFFEAAGMACKVIQAFIANNEDFKGQKGLSAKATDDIGKLLASNRDHDE